MLKEIHDNANQLYFPNLMNNKKRTDRMSLFFEWLPEFHEADPFGAIRNHPVFEDYDVYDRLYPNWYELRNKRGPWWKFYKGW